MKKLSKVSSVILATVMAMSLMTGCGSTDETSKESDVTETQPATEATTEEATTEEATEVTTEEATAEVEAPALKVGISLANSDEFTASLTENYELEAKNYNIETIITNAAGDVPTQLSNVESLIAQQPDVIILRCIDAEQADTLVQMVKEAGIPCIVDETQPATNRDYDLNVMGNQETHGLIIGDYLQQYLDANEDVTLNMLYINGGTSDNIRKRMTGIFEMCTSERLVQVGDELGEWSATKAQEITEAYLTSHPEMNLICCANDEMALAVIETLKSAGRDDIMVFGVDGSSESAANAIREGTLTGTSRNDTAISIKLIFESCSKLVNGEAIEFDDVENKQIDPKAYVLVTKENVESYVYSSSN